MIAVAEKARLGRFDLTVSNPAYQIKVNGNKTAATAVYHLHMNVAQQVTDSITMVYPSRWTQGGKGSGFNEFRETELNSTHYVAYHDFTDATLFFPGVEIKGGINYFLWDANKTKPGVNAYLDQIHDYRDVIRNGKIHVRSVETVTILNKVACRTPLSTIVGSRDYYGIDVSRYQKIEQYEEMEPDSPGSMRILYSKPGRGILSRHISTEHTKRDTGKWKVVASRTASNTKGRKLRRQDRMMIVEPGTIVADNFLVIGQFDTEQEAINMIRYMKTELSSYMYGVLTPTHDATKANYALIPLVNFSTGEILDKSGVFLNFDSPETLDDQIAEAYGFTDGDRDLMTRDVKPWKSRTDITSDE